MANLKEIRERISSISSTMQITSAMKMVSAAKLKKAQNAIVMFRSYSERLQEIIQNFQSEANSTEYFSPFLKQRKARKILYVGVGSNRGLAGAFNASVSKELQKHIYSKKNVESFVLAIGKKVYDSVRKIHKVCDNKSALFENLSFGPVSQVAYQVMEDFSKEKFDEVYLVYNKFVNAATQEVITEKLLPISLSEHRRKKEAEKDYIFEPGRQEILQSLIPKSIKSQLYKAILDSVAAEHGARMTAMHKATDNAQNLKNDLVIFYNKARQTAITNEILEIVSGAEALKGS
ncbi:MAG: ATP synthase F1 subunit gamma [Bergeyella sp.]|nr:ATP synthase F1 subunit gamma [Bergeyella sp.]